MCYGDDNPPEVMSESRPRARKPHRCCECGLPIPVGATYVYTWGKWDGDAGTYKQHVECRLLLQWISDEFCGGESWAFTTLRDELAEYKPEHFEDSRYHAEETYQAARMAHAWMAAIKDQYQAAVP